MYFDPFWIKMEFTSYIIDLSKDKLVGWPLLLDQVVIFIIYNTFDIITEQKTIFSALKGPNILFVGQ